MEILAPKARFNKKLSFKQRKSMRAIFADLIHIKDKILITIGLYPLFFFLEAVFHSLHWTTHARLKSAVSVQLAQSSRKIHWKKTGNDPYEAAVREAEKQRHPKKHK